MKWKMIDREKVIKELEVLKDFFSDGLPGKMVIFNNYINTVNDAIDLLKEQEPVKPVNIRWEAGINGGNCPKCMNWIQRFYNYCPFCGKGMEWE